MRPVNFRLLVLFMPVFVLSGLNAQNSVKPAYLNTSLPAGQRAADLVHRMTVEEKVSQLVNQSRAIPRLNVPDYDWWSEALHGVANNGGITTFPEPVGLAATFDTDVIHRMAIATSVEGRIKYVQGTATATSFRVSTSGPQTSTSFAIPAGDAARKPMGKTHS